MSHKGKADDALRDLGRYLGAMIADNQPTTSDDMAQILSYATRLGKCAYREGIHAHQTCGVDLSAVFRILADCAKALRTEARCQETYLSSNMTVAEMRRLADDAMKHLKGANFSTES